METNSLCRLCSFNCEEFKCLFDENEGPTEVYKISTKYFDSSLLDAGVICTECWQHIHNFYGFQQWILNAQANQISSDEMLCENDTFNSSSALNVIQNEKNPSLDSPNILMNENEDDKIEKNPYKCETCGASFTQYTNLRRHVRKKHKLQPLRRWTCQYCNKTYKNRSYLEKHKSQSHTSERYNEDINFDTFDIEYDEEENPGNLSSDKELNLKKNLCENVGTKCKDVMQKFTMIENEIDSNDRTELKQDSQIHMPALDIVDIKDETDSESDSDVNEQTENIYTEMDKENISYEDLIAKFKDFLECPKCKIKFTKFSLLNEHFQLEHLEERCYIICCDELLYDPRSIFQHLQLHENPSTFKCVDCEKNFKNSRGLNSHRIQVHSENRSAYHLHLCYCKRSKEIYADNKLKDQNTEYDKIVCCQRKKKILEDDALIAEWKKDLKCFICDTNFQYYSLMRAHFYHEHPGEKCYISCCQRKISRISDALDHIRFHLDPNMYKCKKCNIKFSGKKGLSKHMNLAHVDSLPKHRWACDECGKSFKIRQILTRHKNVNHTKKI